MKKIVLALALVGGTLAADAQVYLGGKLGLWSTKDKETNVTLAPEIGYKLNKDFALAVTEFTEAGHEVPVAVEVYGDTGAYANRPTELTA